MCNDHIRKGAGDADASGEQSRRTFIASSAVAATMPFLPVVAIAAPEEDGTAAIGWGTTEASRPLAPIRFSRRALRHDDIKIDILYSGVCHSDIHTARGDWGPVDYTVVPGHEFIGRVSAVGSKVTRFKVGDHAGVGCIVNSCGDCNYCRRGLEQFCAEGFTNTYGRNPDGSITQGGYADTMVVRETYAITIPDGLDIRSAAPLLCAGVTTFSPVQHRQVAAGQKVGVIGLGGLGHIAVKLLHARGADVTVFTTTPAKRADAVRFGAREVVTWDDKASFERLTSRFDLLFSTVPVAYDVKPFVGLLKVDGALINVGVFGEMDGFSNAQLILGRRTLTGSLIGGIPETQEVVDYCAARGIAPEVEVIPMSRINEAWDRVVSKDVRYRYVIDMSTPGLTLCAPEMQRTKPTSNDR